MSIAEKAPQAKADYDAVYDAGKQAEYNRFWDAYQDNGNRTLYQYAFSYLGWNDTTYKPKYAIAPTNAANMFRESQMTVIKNIDFSKCTNTDSVFQSSKVQEIGVFDTRGAGFYYTFNGAKQLRTIEKLILREDGSQGFTAAFIACYALENLTIEGTIGQSGIVLSQSTKLTDKSLVGLSDALACVSAIWTKTDTIYEPVSEEFSFSNPAAGAEYLGRCFTTTGEEVFYYWDGFDEIGTPRQGYLCIVDGVHYLCEPTPNTNPPTIGVGETNLEKPGGQYLLGEATNKGWTVL